MQRERERERETDRQRQRQTEHSQRSVTADFQVAADLGPQTDESVVHTCDSCKSTSGSRQSLPHHTFLAAFLGADVLEIINNSVSSVWNAWHGLYDVIQTRQV